MEVQNKFNIGDEVYIHTDVISQAKIVGISTYIDAEPANNSTTYRVRYKNGLVDSFRENMLYSTLEEVLEKIKQEFLSKTI